MDETDEKILEYLKAHGKGSSGEIAKILGINRTTVHRHLKYLSGLGEVEEEVEKGHSVWKVKEVKKEEVPKKSLIFIPHPYPEAPNFTGRFTEKQMLTNWLTGDPEHPLLSLVAIGGMGKSALAWRWLQEEVIERELELDGIVWWSFYEKDMTFESFLRSFAANRWGKDSPMLGWKVCELQNAIYKEFQQNIYLIVLDGVERILKAYFGLGSPYQKDDDKTLEAEKDYRVCIDPNAATFLRNLTNKVTKSKTLLTTRLHPKTIDTPEGCLKVDLDRLSKDDAVEFFRLQGVKGARSEIEKECEKYGYHPLSLRLLSGMIIGEPGCSGDIKDCEALEEIKDMPAREHNILELAYEALDDAKKEFTSSLAAFRAPMNYIAIKAISKFKTEKDLRKALKEVVNRGLLFWDKQKNRYDLHPIVRSYSYDRLRDKEGIHSQLRDYFAEVPKPEKIESIDDLAPVIELYHHTVRAGRYEEAIKMYNDRLSSPLYFMSGSYQTQIELLEAIFSEGYDNPSVELREDYIAWVYNSLANSYSLSGQPRRAIPLFKRQISIREKQGKKKSIAIGLVNLAYMAQIHIGDLEFAEKNLRQGIEIDIEIVNIKDLDDDYNNLAKVLIYLGNDECEEILEKAMNIATEYNNSQMQGIIFSYRSFLALLIDNPDEALGCAEKAFECAKKYEREEHRIARDFIAANWLIGASCVALRKPNKAEEPLNLAITECRKINLVQHEADILLSLAKLRFFKDKKEESLKLALEALEMADRCSYILQQADIEEFLGNFYLDRGDNEKARQYLEKCLEHCTHCWRYNEDTKDFDYIKKDEKWWYKPRFDKAKRILDKLK
ncbi:MAG: tetratricopeptide repeat protein [Thermoplasmata archaeon]|nr:MAG: tetratricopeptide repeat protein [Thermoplasmata archaeon]